MIQDLAVGSVEGPRAALGGGAPGRGGGDQGAPTDAPESDADDARLEPSIAAFFDAAAPFMSGAITHSEFALRLGPGPSPDHRTLFYQRLMAANVRRILRALFPVLYAIFKEPARAGLDALPTWAELCADFVATLPSRHWSPNALGDALPGYLEAHQEIGAGGLAEPGVSRMQWPQGLDAIAGWSLQRLRAGREAEGVGRVMPGVSAGTYAFDVAHWMGLFESNGEASLRLALGGPKVVLVAYRDPTHQTVRVLRPEPLGLLALGIASGQVARPSQHAQHVQDAVATKRLEQAEAQLIALGLIAKPAVATSTASEAS